MTIGYGTTLTVRRQQRDSDGDLVGAPVDTVSDGWLIAPTSSSEQVTPGRDISTLQLKAYGGPPGAVDISPGDRVYLADDPRIDQDGHPVPPPWHVVGPPERWGNPRAGWEPGSVVTLHRISG